MVEPHVSAQDLEKTDQTEERDVFFEINQTNKGEDRFHCVIEGEPIRIGSVVRMNLKLHNNGPVPIVFDRFKLGCNCLKLVCHQTEILPSEEIKAVAVYRVPKNRTGKYIIEIGMAKGSVDVCRLELSGLMEGVLEILASPAYESNGEVSSWKVPLLVSRPIDPSLLSVELSRELRDLVAKVVSSEGKSFLEIEGSESALGVSGIAGDVTVFDSKTNARTTARIAFIRKPLVRVSPLILQFNQRG